MKSLDELFLQRPAEFSEGIGNGPNYMNKSALTKSRTWDAPQQRPALCASNPGRPVGRGNSQHARRESFFRTTQKVKPQQKEKICKRFVIIQSVQNSIGESRLCGVGSFSSCWRWPRWREL